MRQLRLTAFQFGYEQRSFWRNPAAAFFTFAFPVVVLVIFATMNRHNRVDAFGVSYTQYYVPSMVAFGVMGACFTNLGTTLCVRRQSGYLKRLRSTPLTSRVFFTGLIAHTVAVSAAITAVVISIGALGYDVAVPREWLALAAVLGVGGTTFCLLGIAAATVTPDVEAAPVVLNAFFYPLLFISGAFYPAPAHSVIADIATVFPVQRFIDATFVAFRTQGYGAIESRDLLIIASWGLAAVPVVLWNFRWTPNRR